MSNVGGSIPSNTTPGKNLFFPFFIPTPLPLKPQNRPKGGENLFLHMVHLSRIQNQFLTRKKTNMKKLMSIPAIAALFVLVFLTTTANAQDLIVFKTGK